jgi:hypothetical protein
MSNPMMFDKRPYTSGQASQLMNKRPGNKNIAALYLTKAVPQGMKVDLQGSVLQVQTTPYQQKKRHTQNLSVPRKTTVFT